MDDNYYGIEGSIPPHVGASDRRNIGRILWRAADGDITKRMVASLVFAEANPCWYNFVDIARQLPEGASLLRWAMTVLYRYQQHCDCLHDRVVVVIDDLLPAERPSVVTEDSEEVPF